MPVSALAPYAFPPRDAAVNFNGKLVVYVHWEKHALFSRPMALCLDPRTPFSWILETVVPDAYAFHPDFARIDWGAVRWLKSGQTWSPDPARTLAENGVTHKELIRFITPGLDGLDGAGR